MTVETDVNKRWLQGIEHHPKSIAVYNTIARLDSLYGGDTFDFTCGGDGDNGETLMYLLDIHYEIRDYEVGDDL
jgi:hypothetical protein